MRINKASKFIIMLLTMMMLMSMTVFAATEIRITADIKDDFKQSFIEAEENAERAVGSYLKDNAIKVPGKEKTTETILTWDEANSKLVFDADAFKKANNKKAKIALTEFVNGLKDSTLPLDAQQEIMSEIQESDSDVAAFMIPLIFDESKADLFTAYKWLYPFLQILRVVFGIGSILIILLLVGSTIMDMVYIGLPVWREAQNEKGGGKSNHKFGVSYEAIKTVNEVEKNLGEGGYQNAYLLYLKRRALTYVVLAVCLLYLIVGELGGLISWILGLAGGVVG